MCQPLPVMSQGIMGSAIWTTVLLQGATLTLVRLSGTGKNREITQVGQEHICFMLSDGTNGNAHRKPPNPTKSLSHGIDDNV